MHALKLNRARLPVLGLFLVATLLVGCSNRPSAPALEIVNATLTGADAEYSFRTVSQLDDKNADRWNLDLTAEPPGREIYISLLGSYGLLTVTEEGRSPDVEFLTDNVFYELNFRDQQILSAEEAYATAGSDGREVAALLFRLPEPLAGLVDRNSTELSRDATNRIRSMSDDVHRVYFEFSVDGAPYVADVRFRLALRRD